MTASAKHDPDDEDGPLVHKTGKHYDAHFDITAMIDLVFMLNIFFLVTTVSAAASEMDLPIVRHCLATDPEEAVVISLVANNTYGVTVYLGDGTAGNGLNDREDQARDVHQVVEEGSRAGKRIILLKAEKSVKLKDMKRIGTAATRNITGMELRMGVIERE